MKTKLTTKQARQYYSDAVWLFKDEELTIEERSIKISQYLFDTFGVLQAYKIIKLALPQTAN